MKQNIKPINLILSKLRLSIKIDTFFIEEGKILYKSPSTMKTKDIDKNIKLNISKSKSIKYNFSYYLFRQYH